MSISFHHVVPLLLTLVACVEPGSGEPLSGQESALLPGLPVLASCTGGTANIKIDPATHEVNGTAALSGCTAVGNPAIHSATIDIHGTAIVTLLEVVTFTTDTITWNTGQTTMLSAERTYTGIASVVEIGASDSLAGLLHPSIGAEAGSGTRTNPQPFSRGGLEMLVNLSLTIEVIDKATGESYW